MDPQYTNIDARQSAFNNVGRDQYNQHIQVRYVTQQTVESTESTLQKLQPAHMDACDRAECLTGTRTAIIKFISAWALDPASGTQNVLWLHGLAGAGKSTLSTTIANQFREMGRLGAFLFFDRDTVERSNPATVIRTLAYQIGSLHPRAGLAISAVLQNFPSICISPLRLQFKRLLVDTLSSEGVMDPADGPIILILDALDECGSAETREALLEILAEQSVILPAAIRILITSRSERDIRRTFEARQHILAEELDITSDSNSHDVVSYLRHQMMHVRIKSRTLSLAMDWPGEESIRKLAERASGLFVWAATASRFIDGHDPRRRMDIILDDHAASGGAERALDALYRKALQSAGSWDDDDFVADFNAIFGIVLVAQRPLSSDAIDLLLDAPYNRPSNHTISQLGCILQQNPTVRLLHPSFADFLMTRSRCGRDVWFFDRVSLHRTLSFHCWRRLDVVLKRNLCNLSLSKHPESETLPEDVTYACMFWVDHLCVITGDISLVIERLDDFISQHLLHWFEAMSILRRSRDTIKLLGKLYSWITNNSPDRKSLVDLVHDACRFAQTFAKCIEEHPLLVYHAALPFTPIASKLYQTFHNIHSYPSISGGFDQSWSPLLLVLAEKTNVSSVAISPNGAQIASASGCMIRVWNAHSGAEVLSAIQGHEGLVTSIAFSPDGTRIVSGSDDKTVRIWDANSGAEVLPTMRGHEKSVSSVAFSPDGMHVVSSSYDRTIRMWDAGSGSELLPPLRGHKDSVLSVVFSPDGKRIASGSQDKTIRVWDAVSGIDALIPLQGHEHQISSLAFSSDGTRIVSGSNDMTIRVWDAMSGVEVVPALRGHTHCVTSVAFSADASHIVSGSIDNTIRVWHAHSGIECRPPLRGHGNGVLFVSFSPDGTRIFSGSYHGTIRIWDAQAGAQILPSQREHSDCVMAVAFSPDGSRLVSGSRDMTIRVWDTKSGVTVLPALTGHQSFVLSVKFSLDGARIVSGSHDRTIRVWNANTGASILPALEGHQGQVLSVAFSPDGNHIISGSDDRTARVWDVKSGTEVVQAISHRGPVSLVAFSPDGTCIVTRSEYNTVQVWDAISGIQLSDYHPDTLYYLFPSTIHVTPGDQWLMDRSTNRTISKLPAFIGLRCLATCDRSLAVGTTDGRVFVIHFPSAVSINRETWFTENQGGW